MFITFLVAVREIPGGTLLMQGMVSFSLEFKKTEFVVEGKAWCPERELSGYIMSVVRKEELSSKWARV